MAGLCSPAVLQPLPNIDPCLLSFKYNLDVSKGTLASSGGMRTCDFLDPSEDPSVGDPDVDGGRKLAVDVGGDDEVLLVVVAPSNVSILRFTCQQFKWKALKVTRKLSMIKIGALVLWHNNKGHLLLFDDCLRVNLTLFVTAQVGVCEH